MHHSVYLEYIGPILSFLLFAIFAILLDGIRKRKHVNAADEKGLNWFAWAFWLWAFVGLLKAIGIWFNWTETNLFIGIIVVLSSFNSVSLLNAVGFIDIRGEHWGLKFVKKITDTWVLSAIVVGVMAGTILAISWTDKEKVRKFLIDRWLIPQNNCIWILDNAFSLMTVVALAIVILAAFKEREMTNFKWLVYGMLAFLALNQGLELLTPQLNTSNNFKFTYTTVHTVVSLSYKMVFCMLILVLLYSWRLKDLKQISSEKEELARHNSNLEMKLQMSKVEHESLSNTILHLKEDTDASQRALQIAKEEFSSDKNIPAELMDYSVTFTISSKIWMVRLNPPLSNKWIKVDFYPHLTIFKKLLNLAIKKKYAGETGNDTLAFVGNKGVPPETYAEDDATRMMYIKHYKEFTFRDISDIKAKINPYFEGFEEKYIRRSSNYICFAIPPTNIELPALASHANSAEELFLLYHQEYPVLKKSRV